MQRLFVAMVLVVYRIAPLGGRYEEEKEENEEETLIISCQLL